MNDQKFAEFFAVMMGIFGHKWTLHYGDDPTGISARVWKDGLSELSLVQIAEAIRYYKNKSITSIWPPSLPEFRSVALNIPSIAQVRHDINKKINTPFARLTRSKLNIYAFERTDERGADSMLKEAYQLAVNDLENGVPLPEELVEVEHIPPVFVPETPEQTADRKAKAEKYLNEINKTFEQVA